MKVVKAFDNRPEAEMAALILTRNGIDALIQADDFGGLNPAMSAMGRVRLVTDDEDHETALGLLEGIEEAP